MHVRVVEYDSRWPQMFAEEAEKIQKILGENCIAVHHIGSTSVPNLAAKPIIDILPVVRDLRLVDTKNADFEALGYECMGEFGLAGRRYFRKGGDERTHQIHIFARESAHDIARHLAVRDYLRTFPQEAAADGGLKMRLAQQYPEDIEGYCDGKDAFVKGLEQRALAWKEKHG